MAFYVYRHAASTSARDLAAALGGTRVRAIPATRPGDVLVCWGEECGPIPGVKVLNGGHIQNKYQDALALRRAGVSTIEVSQALPREAAPIDILAEIRRLGRDLTEVRNLAAVTTIEATLREYLTRPQGVVAPVVWLPRRYNHVGGGDLLRPDPRGAQYYSKKEDLIEEYRVHCFEGRSIRAGIKRQDTNFRGQPHAWIRSFDAGWKIVYDGFQSTRQMRDLCAAACTALGLQFAAVDIGKRRDGFFVILECNRAPGIEGNSITAYADAIRQWSTAR